MHNMGVGDCHLVQIVEPLKPVYDMHGRSDSIEASQNIVYHSALALMSSIMLRGTLC